jgi:hypothetical protein
MSPTEEAIRSWLKAVHPKMREFNLNSNEMFLAAREYFKDVEPEQFYRIFTDWLLEVKTLTTHSMRERQHMQKKMANYTRFTSPIWNEVVKREKGDL